MKAYTYNVAELGLSELPPGVMRLAGFDATADPSAADVFIIPCDLKWLTDKQIHALPYLAGNEHRHTAHINSDLWDRTFGLPLILFRCDTNAPIMQREPTAIPWAWGVKDLGEWMPLPAEGFEYDVCFVGWNSTPLTARACRSVERTLALKSFIQLNNEFYGTWETQRDAEKVEYYRRLMLAKMQKSRLSLAPRSIAAGVVRYRFYEALSMGRIPVQLNDNRYLPFQDKIDWDKCSIHIPEADVENVGERLSFWLTIHSDAEILERGAYGRRMWETWLAGAQWEKLWGEIVKEKLGLV